MFVLISLVSYSPGDLREIKYPPNSPLLNKGGAIGARVSHGLLMNFGLAAYVLVFFVGFWSFVVFFRRKLQGLYVKLVAVAVSVFAAATLLSLQGVASAKAFGLASTAPGVGGVYGKAFELFLVGHLGTAGAWLAVVLALAVSLVLSTDWMIYVGVVSAAAAARHLAARVFHRCSAGERAKRHALAHQRAMEQAKAELARR